jgi:hypothetical protein
MLNLATELTKLKLAMKKSIVIDFLFKNLLDCEFEIQFEANLGVVKKQHQG